MNREKIQNQYEEVVAVFNPKITDNLRVCCKEHIGKTYRFYRLWTIDDGYCGGIYDGQYAMQANEMCHWTPYEDLDINE